MSEERLQKVMAAAGVASRRACEEMIAAGRVAVNGHTVTELGTKVDPDVVQITVDGKPIHLPKRHTYLKVHKPRGVISDIGGDAEGRKNVADLLPDDMRRLFPVGRLDLNSEGLILMTDDGDLANKLTHPRYEHPKTYYVLVADRPPASALEQLRTGVDLPEGKSAPAEVRVVTSLPQGMRLGPGPSDGVWLEIVLREGKKRQIRHMTAAVGFATLRLVRWAIGPLTLDDVKVGEFVPLTRGEVAALREAVRAGGRMTPTGADAEKPAAPAQPQGRPFGRNARREVNQFGRQSWRAGKTQGPRGGGRPPRNSGNR